MKLVLRLLVNNLFVVEKNQVNLRQEINLQEDGELSVTAISPLRRLKI
jgi:hypothetical protein